MNGREYASVLIGRSSAKDVEFNVALPYLVRKRPVVLRVGTTQYTSNVPYAVNLLEGEVISTVAE